MELLKPQRRRSSEASSAFFPEPFLKSASRQKWVGETDEECENNLQIEPARWIASVSVFLFRENAHGVKRGAAPQRISVPFFPKTGRNEGE